MSLGSVLEPVFGCDMDGDLDLFVADYVGFEFEEHQITHMNGYLFTLAVELPFDPQPLYENIQATSGSISEGPCRFEWGGMGVIASDLDNDGDMDVFVANDLRPDPC